MTIVSVGGTSYSDYREVYRGGEHDHDPTEIKEDNTTQALDLTNIVVDTLKIDVGGQMKNDSALAFTPASPNGTQIPLNDIKVK